MRDWQQEQTVIFVGTRKLAVFHGSLGENDPSIFRHVIINQPAGFQSGFVTHLDQAALSIQRAFDQLNIQTPLAETACHIVFGNSKLRSYRCSSSQYFQGSQRTVSASDVRAIVRQTRSVATHCGDFTRQQMFQKGERGIPLNRNFSHMRNIKNSHIRSNSPVLFKNGGIIKRDLPVTE